jgi:hypothetical protein
MVLIGARKRVGVNYLERYAVAEGIFAAGFVKQRARAPERDFIAQVVIALDALPHYFHSDIGIAVRLSNTLASDF